MRQHSPGLLGRRLHRFAGVFLGLRLGHLFERISQRVELGRDRDCRWQFFLGVAEPRDQLVTDFWSGQTRIEPGATKLRIGLTLPIHDGAQILEQVRQLLFTPFPASEWEGIHTHQSAFQFMLAFPDRSTIPA